MQSVWFLAACAVLAVLVFIVQSRRSKELRERLEMLAREMSWYDVKSSGFFTLGVQGTWNGYNVRIRRAPQQKGVPERIVTNIRIQSPARLIVTRKQHGVFGGRPMTLFGPPLIEAPFATQFWIRADEINLAERIMRSSAAALLDRALQSRFDQLKMSGDSLRVERVSTKDPDGVARIAREELDLLRAVIDALALRP